jgi:hypothetical protein
MNTSKRGAENDRLVLECLSRGPKTRDQLRFELGMGYESVQRSLDRLTIKKGLVVAKNSREVDWPNLRSDVTVYVLKGKHEKKEKYKGIPAGKIMIPQFNWCGTRLG